MTNQGYSSLLNLTVHDGPGVVLMAVRPADAQPMWQHTVAGSLLGMVADDEQFVLCWTHGLPDGEQIFALHKENGSLAWMRALPFALVYTVWTPTALISHDPRGNVSGFSCTTGALIWQQKIGDSSPLSSVVSHDKVLLASADGQLWALHAGDGSVAWSRWIGAIKTNAVAASESIVLAVLEGNTLIALDAKRGIPLWRRPIDHRWSTTPVLCGDSVLIVTDTGFSVSGLVRLRLSDGRTIQQYHVLERGIPMPKVVGDIILVASAHRSRGNARRLSSYDSRQGASGSAGDTDRTDTYLLAIKLSDGQQIWEQQFPGLGEGISRPVVLDGVIFLTFLGASGLYAFRMEDGTPLWHAFPGRRVRL